MADTLEDLDPAFSKKPGQKKKVDTSELEALDPAFSRPLPKFDQNEEISVQELPAPYRMVRKALIGEGKADEGLLGFGGMALGAGAGAVEQSRNVLGLLRPPRVGPVAEAAASPESAKAKWLRNWAGIERTGPGGVPEGAQTYQRTKTHGEAGKKLYQRYGTMPLDIGRQVEAAEEAAELARRSELARRASQASRALGYIPGLSLLAGTAGGVDIAKAMQRGESGDVPGALIQGLGGLGALASLIPHPIPRLIGGGLSLASMPAMYYYDILRGKREAPEPTQGLSVLSP